MMRLKLDENVPRPLADEFRAAVHDVHTVSDENLLGQSDEVIWSVAVEEDRLLVTLDRDFGHLTTKTAAHPGALVLRPRDPNQQTIMTLARRAPAVAIDIDMKHRTAIFDDERIRIRPPLGAASRQDPK
jgi:predicted nuclease of predicted toxin-antitoxin system